MTRLHVPTVESLASICTTWRHPQIALLGLQNAFHRAHGLTSMGDVTVSIFFYSLWGPSTWKMHLPFLPYNLISSMPQKPIFVSSFPTVFPYWSISDFKLGSSSPPSKGYINVCYSGGLFTFLGDQIVLTPTEIEIPSHRIQNYPNSRKRRWWS